MAAPIIDGVTPASPIVFTPGQTRQVQVLAHDPDAGPPVSQVFKVQDSTGNETPITVTLQEQDPLTYSFDAPPTGWTITPVGGTPGLFSVKAP